MARDWETTSAILSYTGALSASQYCSGFIKLYIQYDLNSATPTSIDYRFKIDNTNSSSTWTSDEYFIFWRPNEKDKEKFFRVKEGGAKWPGYSSVYTLTKDWDTDKFSLPEFWLCHTGAICNGKTVFDKKDGYLYMTYGDAKTQKIYWYFTNNRQNFKTTKDGYTFPSISKSKATAVSKGTVSITDNGDNTFTLKGTKGAAGTNNPSTGPTLSWGYTDSYGTSFSNNDKKTLTMTDTSKASRRVYAKSVTGATYGSNKTATTYTDVKQYVAPGKAGKPSISYTKSRLTIKEDWTISWGAATATNTSSPIKGYRVRIYKNDDTIPIYSINDGALLTTLNGTNKNRYYYDRELTTTSFNFRPTQHGIVPGDKIKISVYAYTRNGTAAKAQLFSSDAAVSDVYEVRHSGIVRVKSSSKWKEGQVYVKVGGKWKEAETIQIKVGGKWKEAQ